jgi:hypothetical protein
MKHDKLGYAQLTSDRGELSEERPVAPKNYEAPTLVKRAVLSAITSEVAPVSRITQDEE